ncbi:flavin reductase family protein [Candidatus Bathyarchaeota archaeon]|nr:flavin reductase family protein [Candidatus Bathyarchaeota archaeon]
MDSISSKVFLEPSTKLFPIPTVMVSCCTSDQKHNNIITLAWVGTVSSEPPMVSISVRKSRYSYGLLMETKDFVINIPDESQVAKMDWCGVKSGRDHDKFTKCGLTPARASKVKSPIILECPVNLECKVRHIVQDISRSHDIFLAEIVSVDVNKEFVDFSDPAKMNPIAYCNGKYYSVGKMIGKPGIWKHMEEVI